MKLNPYFDSESVTMNSKNTASFEKRPRYRILAFGLLCFLLGVCVTWFFGVQRSGLTDTGTRPDGMSSGEVNRRNVRNAERAKNSEKGSPGLAVAPDEAGSGQGPVFLDERKSFAFPTDVDLLDASGQLSGKAAVALNLKPEEIEHFNQTLQNFRNKIVSHLKTTVTKVEPPNASGQDVYRAPPFPQVFKTAKADFEKELAERISLRKITILVGEMRWKTMYGHEGQNYLDFSFEETDSALGKVMRYKVVETSEDGKARGGAGGDFSNFQNVYGNLFELSEGNSPILK